MTPELALVIVAIALVWVAFVVITLRSDEPISGHGYLIGGDDKRERHPGSDDE